MKKRFFVILAASMAVYLGAYALLYARRAPAANMMYFVFLKNPDSILEQPVFYFFYPVYKIHRLVGGQPHNANRPG